MSLPSSPSSALIDARTRNHWSRSQLAGMKVSASRTRSISGIIAPPNRCARFAHTPAPSGSVQRLAVCPESGAPGLRQHRAGKYWPRPSRPLFGGEYKLAQGEPRKVADLLRSDGLGGTIATV